MAIIPRDYQQELMDKVLLAFRAKKKRPLVVAATGSGKTVVFSAIAQRAAEKGNKVLILAHRDTLIKQASGKLKDYGVRHGIIMAGFTPNLNVNVQVASVQTLVRRLKNLRFVPDLIIIDEAHLSAAASYLKILDHFSGSLVIGFTGSPCRLDNKPLGVESGGIYDELIQAISIQELIRRGFLVPPRVFAPAEQLDLSGIKKSMGDYKTDDLAAVVDKPKITGSAVEHYKRICNGVPAVAWCITVAHAQHVADEFNAQGVTAVMLCGEHDTGYRDKVLKQLETGEVKVVTFVGILIEGVDVPAISAVILLRPTMSLASYLQVIGRGLRPYTNAQGVAKECCFVLDHAGLSFKHGLADEEREWDLNGEIKRPGKKKAPEEKNDVLQCTGKDACFGVFTKAPACPHCGKPVEVVERGPEHVDGQLVEITPEMTALLRKKKQKEVKGAKTLEELERIGAERGYSPGWAKTQFEMKSRTRAKYARLSPPEPTTEQLKMMSIEQLEKVAREQGWPRDFASEFYHTQGAGAGSNLFKDETPGGVQ